MNPFEKYISIYQRAVDDYEEKHPNWRIEVLVSLIKWSLRSLKHYIENVSDPEITWENPLVELHYPIKWNWQRRGSGDVAPGGHLYGNFTTQNTATKRKAVKTLSEMMAEQFNATALAHLTNWAWFEKLNNYYTPVLPVQLAAELGAIKNKNERRLRFDELVRPFSIGAARIDFDFDKLESGKPLSKRLLRKFVASRQRMDFDGIRFTGEVNGRKADLGLVFEIHPMIADYDQQKAYHPVVVGLAVLNGNPRVVKDEIIWDTPDNWPKMFREKLWSGLLREMEKLTGLLIPKTKSKGSVIVSFNSKLKIPVEHWKPENQSAEIKKVTDALTQIGEIEQFNIEPAKAISDVHSQNVCSVCGWIHDVGFTQIKTNLGQVIMLGGILPDIVTLVHRAHERGLAGVSTKDAKLIKICGGYRHPCKAFDNLKHRDDYKALFETRKRGFISLRGALGIIRNKSESNLE